MSRRPRPSRRRPPAAPRAGRGTIPRVARASTTSCSFVIRGSSKPSGRGETCARGRPSITASRAHQRPRVRSSLMSWTTMRSGFTIGDHLGGQRQHLQHAVGAARKIQVRDLEPGSLAQQGLDHVGHRQGRAHPVGERVPDREDHVVGLPGIGQRAPSSEPVGVGARDDPGAPDHPAVLDEREDLARARRESLAEPGIVLTEHGLDDVEGDGSAPDVSANSDLGQDEAQEDAADEEHQRSDYQHPSAHVSS